MVKLLIVDDNETTLYISRVLLEGHQYAVVLARNGKEALQAARREPPDMIISDIMMPVMDGYALCREWMSDDQLRTIPFLFCTATYTDRKDEELGLSLGALKFLMRPVEPDVLLETIEEILQESRVGIPRGERPDELTSYQNYAGALTRKLEQKASRLEGTNRDLVEEIEKRKASQQELAEQKKYYRSLLRALSEDIMVLDHENRIVDVNRTTLVSTGRTLDEVIGRHCYEFLYGNDSPCDAHGQECFFQEVLTSGEPRKYLHDYERADGSRQRLNILLSPMKSEDGEVTHIVKAVRHVDPVARNAE